MWASHRKHSSTLILPCSGPKLPLLVSRRQVQSLECYCNRNQPPTAFSSHPTMTYPSFGEVSQELSTPSVRPLLYPVPMIGQRAELEYLDRDPLHVMKRGARNGNIFLPPLSALDPPVRADSQVPPSNVRSHDAVLPPMPVGVRLPVRLSSATTMQMTSRALAKDRAAFRAELPLLPRLRRKCQVGAETNVSMPKTRLRPRGGILVDEALPQDFRHLPSLP